MTKIIYFEFCALVIEVLILYSLYNRGLTRGRVNKWYIGIVSAITVATISDIVGMGLEYAGPGYVVGKYIANLVCLESTTSAPMIMCGYLFVHSGIWYKIKKDRICQVIFYAPLVINLFILNVINPFLKCIFYIDDNGVYARGDAVIIMYVLSFVYVYIGFCVVTRYHYMYSARKIVSVIFLLSSAAIATIIQYIFPNVIIQMFITACAALVLLFEVQALEERVQGETGLLSFNAYVQDTRKWFDIGVQFEVVLAVITNYDALIDMLGYFKALTIINQISVKIIELFKEIRIDADCYYLENGRFSIIVDDRYKNRQFEMAHAINELFNSDFIVGETRVKVMANVCEIMCPDDIDDPSFLVAFDEKVAEEAYSGELRYAEKLFDKKQFELKHDFLRIIDRGFAEHYLSLEYQPVYSVTDKKFVCAEAFLRFNDPEFGYIEPTTVIAEAEKSSSIHAITAYVLDEVCQFLSQPDFLLLGLEFIEINLSPIQCMWGDLLTVVLSTVRTYNVQPKNICFNITDIDSRDIYDGMKDNLEALNQVGFRLIMDDFGAGVFEIERIATMPLMGIKLDRGFVKEGLEKEKFSILKGTTRMISDMGIGAAAVGIENEAMAELLQDLGCTMMQGYHYCKPLSKSELIRYILMK